MCIDLASKYLPLPFILGLILCALGQNFALMCLCCACDCGNAIHKLGLEEHVSVGEHSILQRHHHELQKGKKKSC